MGTVVWEGRMIDGVRLPIETVFPSLTSTLATLGVRVGSTSPMPTHQFLSRQLVRTAPPAGAGTIEITLCK